MRLRPALLGLATLVLFVSTRPAEAIPAFARKYEFSCSTCHAPFPRLKPYGEEFAARGFRLEDPAQEPTRAARDVGDPLLWLPRDVPLAVRMDGYASWKEDAEAEADFEFPWQFKVLSGGPISKSISYYVYAIFEKGESVKLEDAWMQFSSIFGAPIDVMFGQFQVSDPLFKRELRLERFDYLIYKAKVGNVSSDLTYDRGLVVTGHLPASVDVILEVVNGNGIEEADEVANFDNDSNKNVALRVVAPVGPVRLGAFGYWGKEEGAGGVENRTTWWGPDFVWSASEKVELNLQYLERCDDDPFFTGLDRPEVDTRGGFAELHVFPRGPDGRWAVSFLYNKVDSDDLLANAETASLTLNWLAARNVRLVAEGGRDLESDATRVSFGVVTAF